MQLRSPAGRLLAQLRPSVPAAGLPALVLLLIGVEIGLSSGMALLFRWVDPAGALAALQFHDLIFALLLGPLAAALLGLAAMLDSGMGFRAVLLAGQSLVLLGAMVSGTTVFAMEDDGAFAAGVMFFLYGPAALGAATLALGAAVSAASAARELGVHEAELWIAARLGRAGWLDVGEASTALGRGEDWVHDVAVRLVVDHRLPVRHQGRWLVTRDHVARGMARTLDELARGKRRTVDELAGTLSVPAELASSWVDELALDPTLPVTVDRERGAVLWEAATGTVGTTWCPRCGGPEHLAGGGLVRCTGCGGEREP